MRIALLNKEFYPVWGGGQRYAEALARTLARMGHEVHMLSSRLPSGLPESVRFHPVPRVPLYSLLPKPWPLVLETRRALRDIPRDITYSMMPFYPTDMYRVGEGVFLHWHSLKYPNSAVRAFASWMPKKMAFLSIERELYTNGICRAFVANSGLVKRHIVQYYRVPPEKIHVVHNGVDHAVFRPDGEDSGLRRSLGIPEDRLWILFVANNWQRKGLETLLRGAAELIRKQEAVVAVVGRGHREQWANLIDSLGIAGGVRFEDMTPRIADWYRGADVMVLPTHYDPFANVTLEAMASGLPVVTSAENGAAELIEHGRSGYVLSDIRAHGELAGMLASLRDRDFRKEMGQRAHAASLPYTPEANAAKTLEICESLRSESRDRE